MSFANCFKLSTILVQPRICSFYRLGVMVLWTVGWIDGCTTKRHTYGCKFEILSFTLLSHARCLLNHIDGFYAPQQSCIEKQKIMLQPNIAR